MRWRAGLLNAGLGECIRRQTSPPEAAYLLLAEGDERFFDKYIDREVFRPVYLREGMSLSAGLSEVLARDGFFTDVILSRVDSDDLITRDYFERVTAVAHENLGADLWLVAADGQRSDLRRVQDFHFPDSPFVSRYMKSQAGESIFRNHRDVRELDPVTIDGVLWWQLLHGSNLVNSFWRSRPLDSYDPDREFSGEYQDLDPRVFHDLFGFTHERLLKILRRGAKFTLSGSTR